MRLLKKETPYLAIFVLEIIKSLETGFNRMLMLSAVILGTLFSNRINLKWFNLSVQVQSQNFSIIPFRYYSSLKLRSLVPHSVLMFDHTITIVMKRKQNAREK